MDNTSEVQSPLEMDELDKVAMVNIFSEFMVGSVEPRDALTWSGGQPCHVVPCGHTSPASTSVCSSIVLSASIVAPASKRAMDRYKYMMSLDPLVCVRAVSN